ncbi:MAG: proprotein convertase P-domain-containing protein, partial [Deltaproteobacteria bacterium]|nr:proprotein convertase P-domain-containing protein [Deltaproteobacteria bacterium]
DGNLDLELIGPDGSTVVASSTTTSDAEAIEDLSVGSGDEGTYTVRVYAAAGVQNVYDLLITLSDDPCFPNPCTTPPATSCTGVEVLTRYASPGDCTNNAGQAECDYQEEVIDCAASGLLCDEAGAACVECLDDADCAWPFEVCDASACTAGCQDDAYEDNDIIDTATSVSDGTDWSDLVLCGGDPDHYAVDLVANEEISVAIRFTHADGDLDLLLLDPTGTTAVGFSSSTTDDESIGYTAEQSGLHYIVVFGANVGDENVYRLTVSVFDDPCLPNPCTSAPADVCVGDVLTTYSAPGACTDNAGTPECDYPIDTQTDCTLTGGICQAAACAGRFADVGDVLVSEYLAHPLYVTAANGEWMEIHNRSADQVNLRGLVFSDASSNTFTVQDDIMLAPGDEAVLAINGDPLTNGDVAADYDYPNAFSLNDANETISISRDGALVDAVSWAASTGGASAQLDPAHLDADSNDFDEYWCDSTATWGSGTDLGSPGGDNTDCSAGTRSIDWCMVQFPQDIQANPDAAGVVYARLYIAGLTEPDPVDPVPELAAQVGFGSGAPDGTWTWFPAWPNPGWDGGGSNNDEYMGRMRVPASGDHSFAFRFSGDHGASWTACDRDDTSWDNPPLLSVAYQATFDYTPTAGLPLAIPDNDPLGASYTVNADWFTTADLTIELAITHPDAGELIVDLVNPEGTVVRLHNLSGAGTSDLSAHYGVSDTPDGPGALADYNGETAANAWTLYVIDTSATAGSGTLDSWTLHFSAE